MNCPECFRVVFVTQTRCACGAALTVPKAEATHAYAKNDANDVFVLRPEMREKLSHVNAFITRHRTENPKATVRESCIEFLKKNVTKNNIVTHIARKLPANLQGGEPRKSFDDVMDEYRESVEA